MRLINLLAILCIGSFVFAYYEMNQQLSGMMIIILWAVFAGLVLFLGRFLVKDKKSKRETT